VKEAAQDLKGGLRALLEGLAHLGPPCARRLSVAGFFVSLGLFPGREGFILRRREASFCPGRPLLFNLSVKSANMLHGTV